MCIRDRLEVWISMHLKYKNPLSWFINFLEITVMWVPVTGEELTVKDGPPPTALTA